LEFNLSAIFVKAVFPISDFIVSFPKTLKNWIIQLDSSFISVNNTQTELLNNMILLLDLNDMQQALIGEMYDILVTHPSINFILDCFKDDEELIKGELSLLTLNVRSL
jgi:hypothetical protein